jgi:hypothetical protein
MFVYIQHKAIADVLQCNDDDGNDNSSDSSLTIATVRAKYG